MIMTIMMTMKITITMIMMVMMMESADNANDEIFTLMYVY